MDFAANKRELRCRTSIDNDYVDSTETRLPRHLTMERIDHVSVSFLASRDSLQHTSILMQREPSFLHSLHETVFEMTKMMKRIEKLYFLIFLFLCFFADFFAFVYHTRIQFATQACFRPLRHPSRLLMMPVNSIFVILLHSQTPKKLIFSVFLFFCSERTFALKIAYRFGRKTKEAPFDGLRPQPEM